MTIFEREYKCIPEEKNVSMRRQRYIKEGMKMYSRDDMYVFQRRQ